MTFAELETEIQKYMLLADKGIIKLLCSFVIAARLKINPPWVFIVGASSGGKSMLLKSLQSCNHIVPIDDLTATTFVSGMKGKDGESNSLLSKLNHNSILLFKDFTTIISKDKENKGIVIGQMRKIYDGDFSKMFGNGENTAWQGRVSVLAGVTSKVHTTMHQFSDMGERFLMYTLLQPDRKAVTMAATADLEDGPKESAMKTAFKAFIDSVPIPEKAPIVPFNIREDLIDLAELCTRARSSVERNMYDREKPIIMVHGMEMPVRFAKQVLGIASGMLVVNQVENPGTTELTSQDKEILYNVSLDSIPAMRRVCLQLLTKYRQVETSGLAIRLQLPPSTLRIPLQDLAAVGVINYTKGSNNRDKWELKDEFRAIISKYEHIETVEDSLTEDSAETDKTELRISSREELTETEQSAIDIFGGEAYDAI